MLKPNDTVFLILTLVATCATLAFHLLKRCLLLRPGGGPGAGSTPTCSSSTSSSTTTSPSSSSESSTAPPPLGHFPADVVDFDHPDGPEYAQDIRFVSSEEGDDSVEPDEV